MTMHRTNTSLAAGAATAMLLASGAACSAEDPETDAAAADSTHQPAGDETPAAGNKPRAGEDISPEVHTELAVARAVSAPYHQVERAETDEYGLPPAPAPLHECISAVDAHGAMGLHYISSANLDAELDASLPEVLVYEPTKNGRLRLVALEYVVFEDAWEAEHGDTTPQLFGRDLTYVGEGNRYELPPFYQIHTWVWRYNPDGMFADHNRQVSCPDTTDEG